MPHNLDVTTKLSCVLALMLGLAASIPSSAQPVVAKIEPPNWWTGLTPNLMILVHGRGLAEAKVTCGWPGITVESAKASTTGDYLLIDLTFAANCRDGTADFQISTSAGDTSFALPLASRKPTPGRNQGLSSDDVVYLIMPDRFANSDSNRAKPFKFRASKANQRSYHGGDLQGVRRRLAYFKELGVTALWLTPIVKNADPTNYHGYSAVDLYSVETDLGALDDYKDLVAAAHRAGMKIVFDVVPNHVGPSNAWVADAPLPDWFHGTRLNHLPFGSPFGPDFYGERGDDKVSPGNLFESLEDPHATQQMRRGFNEGWFPTTGNASLPDMNTENPTVVKYLIQNSIWWAEISGLDAYRVDTFPYVSRQFWAEWNSALQSIYPNLTTIGEVFHPDPTVTSFFAGGHIGWDGIDTKVATVFDFPTYFTLRDVLTEKKPLGAIPNILRQDALYPHPERLVTFFGNHDTERLASVVGGDLSRLKLAFGLVLTLRGIPEIYYGDELGMRGGKDPDNRRDFPGGWPDDPRNAFNSEGRTKAENDLFEFVKDLLALRREHPALHGGGLWHLASGKSYYVFLRQSGVDRVVVAVNRDRREPLPISIKDTPAAGAVDCRTIFGRAQARLHGNDLLLELPARSVSLVQLE